MSLSGEFESGGEVHDALKAKPEGLHAGLAVALTPQEAAQLGDQAQHRVEARGLLGERRLGEDISGLPLPGFEQEGRVPIGQVASDAHPPGDAPGHHQEQGQRALDTLHGGELQRLDAAAFLEHQLELPSGERITEAELGARLKVFATPCSRFSGRT